MRCCARSSGTGERSVARGVGRAWLPRLSRRTTTGRFIPEIDGLRFIAIAMVVLTHVNGLAADAVVANTPGLTRPGLVASSPVMQAAQVGRFGVHIFFVISGFVLALPFISAALLGGDRVRLGRYYLRRVTRIEPPYLIMLTLVLLGLVLFGGMSLPELWPSYTAGLVYLHGPLFDSANPLNIITWSLEVEIQFYLVMPLLAFVFRIRGRTLRRAVLVAAILVAASLRIVGPAQRMPWLSWTLIDYLQYFLAGFLLADIYLVDWRRSAPRGRGWSLAAAAAWIGTFFVMRWAIEPMAAFRGPPRWILPLVLLLAMYATLRSPLLSRFLARPWIFTIGGMCYSIYLTHVPVVRLLGQATGGLVPGGPYLATLGVQLLLLVPAVLLVSVAYFVLVERPCMNPRWPQDLSARFRRTEAESRA